MNNLVQDYEIILKRLRTHNFMRVLSLSEENA